jgi:hypothetical protein
MVSSQRSRAFAITRARSAGETAAPRQVAALSASKCEPSSGLKCRAYLRRSLSSRELFIQLATTSAQKTTKMMTANDSFMLDLQGGFICADDRISRTGQRN